jgi:tripartite-type tricarboxylate transporter receptor subunit TctC
MDARVQISEVSVKVCCPAMQDLLGGRIDAMCDLAPNVVPQVNVGTIRALAVAQASRSATAPDVPTAAEAGSPRFDVVGWTAIVAPRNTPKEIVAKVNAAVNAALTDPVLRRKIMDLGAIPTQSEQSTPEWMDKFLRSEVDTWGAVIHAAGASIE